MNAPISPRHLTEAERHDAADGSLAPELQADVTEHLARCATCTADVARVRELMSRVREAPLPADSSADLWPEIRSRIEREKIIQLPAAETPALARRASRTAFWVVGGLAAALLLVLALPQARRIGKARMAANPVELQLVADSARAYEREATILLNELELRRAMIPPHQRTTLDRDLRIIDDAILELKEAIARDPNNPALRRLLAASYKQKIDLLKRVGG